MGFSMRGKPIMWTPALLLLLQGPKRASAGISLGASIMRVTSGIGHCTSAGGWKTFKSTKYRFTVRYPASWYLFPPLDGALDILNFPPDQRVHGVILKESGARINVGPIPSQMTMEQWSKKNTEFDTQTSEREIKNFTKNPSGCTKLVEVT